MRLSGGSKPIAGKADLGHILDRELKAPVSAFESDPLLCVERADAASVAIRAVGHQYDILIVHLEAACRVRHTVPFGNHNVGNTNGRLFALHHKSETGTLAGKLLPVT